MSEPQILGGQSFTTSDSRTVQPARSYVDGGDHQNGIPWAHNYLHQGVSFGVGDYQEALADDGTIEITLTIGSSLNAHTVVAAAAGGNALVQIYETAVITTPGSALTPFNLNRGSATASSVVVNLAGTINVGGATLLRQVVIPGGSGGNAGGGSDSSRDEIVLELSTIYLYRITNIAGTAQPVSLNLEWYEHEPIT